MIVGKVQIGSWVNVCKERKRFSVLSGLSKLLIKKKDKAIKGSNRCWSVDIIVCIFNTSKDFFLLQELLIYTK